jgi:hypothetical protein
LTLQRPPTKGPLETAVVAYPKTYEVNPPLLFGAAEPLTSVSSYRRQ